MTHRRYHRWKNRLLSLKNPSDAIKWQQEPAGARSGIDRRSQRYQRPFYRTEKLHSNRSRRIFQQERHETEKSFWSAIREGDALLLKTAHQEHQERSLNADANQECSGQLFTVKILFWGSAGASRCDGVDRRSAIDDSLPICAFENFCRAGGAGFCPTENSLVLAGAIPATKNLFGEPAGADRNADSANCRSTISNRFFNFDSVWGQQERDQWLLFVKNSSERQQERERSLIRTGVVATIN